MADEQIKLPDSLEDAERFQRLFVAPMVESVRTEVKTIIAPLHDLMNTQKATIDGHEKRLAAMEGNQGKAMIGWGVFATGLSVALSGSWSWVKGKFQK